MSTGPSPDAALSPSALYSLYLGGLALDDQRRRLVASYVVLGTGRLGLRPGELQHCHEGWIDWQRGELHVPTKDPCTCDLCVESARTAQRAGDGRPLGRVVSERWSPPSSEGRTVAFGWSERLTAVLARTVDRWPYVDESVADLQALVTESARNAAGLDPDAIDLAVLRATAGAFFADTGFDAPRIAALLDVDLSVAAEFAGREGGRARDHLYEALDAEPPALTGADPDYPIVCDPTSLDREPFDATRFDPTWRRKRAEDRGDRPLRNPRPDALPDGVEYDPTEHGTATHLDVESGAVTVEDGTPVASSLRGWVRGRDDDRRNVERSASAGSVTGESGDSPAGGTRRGDDEAAGGPRARLTKPVELEVSTVFACDEVRGGMPTTGRIVVGQSELLVGATAGDAMVDHCVIPLDAVADLAFDYVPTRLNDTFESTLGVAYELDDDRNVAVLDIDGDTREAVATTLFELVLSNVPAVVTHPAQRGGRVTDEDPVRCRLSADDGVVRIDGAGDDTVSVLLSDVIHVDRSKQLTPDGDVHRGLAIRHLRSSGEAVTTEVAPEATGAGKLLERLVIRDYRQRRELTRGLSLSEAQKEVLVALYATAEDAGLSTMLEKDREELSTLMRSLESAGLVRSDGGSPRLTGTGQMLVGDTVEHVND